MGAQVPAREAVAPGTHGSYPSPTSPAVRVGDVVHFSGIVGFDADRRLVAGGAGPQAVRALATIADVLSGLGGSLRDVVHLRIFVVDRADLPAVSAALDDAFGTPWPPTTIVVVAGLATEELRVEVEPLAVLAT